MPLTAYILLMETPADLAALWGTDVPGKIPAPGARDAVFTFGEDIAISASLTERVSSPDLSTDGSISLLTHRVMPVVTGHVAALELRANGDESPAKQQRALCEAIVSLPPLTDAVVWLPGRHQATTQVVFVGELMDNPTRAFYWLHPSWVDEEHTSAIATVRGLDAVGAENIQVSGPVADLVAFAGEVESFVDNAIAVGRVPLAGDTAEIGGTVYACSTGIDVLTGDSLVQLTPIPSGGAPALSGNTPTIQPHWLAPHSEQISEFEGPYDQLARAFEELHHEGIVARMDFACCQNCGHTEIGDERTVLDASAEYPYREHGYTFFHQQDSDGLAEGSDSLYLAYGAFPGGRYLTRWPEKKPETEEEKEAFTAMVKDSEKEVGQLVTQTLQRHGLHVDWDGNSERRIAVLADWSSVSFPWSREDEEDYDDDVDVTLPAYDPALSDNAWYLLLDSQPESLGEPLQDLMPNYSSRLSADGDISGEIPYGDPDVTLSLTLIEKIDDPRMAQHAARSDDPDEAAARIERHVTALGIAGHGTAAAYEQVLYQASVASEVGKRPEVLGLWVPNQERFEVRADLINEEQHMNETRTLPAVSIHRTQLDADEGMVHVLYTRGMSRLGTLEFFTHDPDEVDTDNIRALVLALADDIAESGKVLQPGDTLPTFSKKLEARMHESEDPVTGEPALNLELVKRKRFLGLF